MKNIIDKAKNRKIPSERTIVANDAIPNAIYIFFELSDKNKTKESVKRKINSGSVTPNNEFSIILGSKLNIAIPIMANFLSTNLLHKK